MSLVLLVAVPMVSAWSFGISATIFKAYSAIPLSLVVGAVATGIVGAFMLMSRLIRTDTGQRVAQIFTACLVLPMFATVFGGIYVWAADRLFRGRDPGMTATLGAGLGLTVFGFGLATGMEALHMTLVFAGSLAGLIAVRLAMRQQPIGFIGFGALHFLCFFAAMAVASIEDEQRHRPFAPNIASGK
ncbi:hypothetical protein OKA05_00650 [Luteolibacter arcticus]|uniref:Uncharacterized protein n=2 Tax=Luteolibacter arcticus TaxID=1581411 RepID=A0ABT3GBN7_9BACT|nr:hypothetical protein [Luteolibacter arcticus]